MEFAFTEEQQMIRETAAAFLAEVSTSEAVRRAMATESAHDLAAWRRICSEMYWQAILVPEECGGLGLGYVELASVLEACGETLLCSPFFATVVLGVNTLLAGGDSEQRGRWLPGIAAGETTATLAWMRKGGRWGLDDIGGRWRADGDGYVVAGDYSYVIDGHTADLLLIAARAEGSEGDQGVALFAVPAAAAGVTRQWTPTMDQTRQQARVVLDAVRLGPDNCLGVAGEAGPALARALQLAAVCTAAEQCGVAARSLRLAVNYTAERVQFGRTIASYQAIKHKAADMKLREEVARSAVYYAACVAQEAVFGDATLGAELGEAASMAKAYCSDAAFFNAGSAIQMFGGVGFTWEYDIQLYFKRARSTETFLGDGAFHRERVAELLLDREAAA